MGKWGKLSPEEWEEEKAWRESHPDSAGERLVDEIGRAVDDIIDPFGLLHDKESREQRRQDDEYVRYDDCGYDQSGGGSSGCSFRSCLIVLFVLFLLWICGCRGLSLLLSLFQLLTQ